MTTSSNMTASAWAKAFSMGCLSSTICGRHISSASKKTITFLPTAMTSIIPKKLTKVTEKERGRTAKRRRSHALMMGCEWSGDGSESEFIKRPLLSYLLKIIINIIHFGKHKRRGDAREARISTKNWIDLWSIQFALAPRVRRVRCEKTKALAVKAENAETVTAKQ